MAERILFVTSNGTGLGHLTRSMAIARRLPDGIEPLFLTLSAAAPVVREMGFPVEYVASYSAPGTGNDYRWSRRLRARLRTAIAEAAPAALVFDGTHPYEAVLGAFPRETTTVWCRRALWKQGSSRAPLGREGQFDAVLEPGELAASLDRGPTVPRRANAHHVDPIVLLDRRELLPRAEAEAGLGLDPDRPHILVALGQGAEVREATARCLRHLSARGDIQVAALSSAIAAAGDVPEGVVHLESTYPISRYFAAFDGAVAAAGYNSYHELIHLGVPSIFVPMRRETDDQPARARYAEQAGVGLATASADDPRLEEQLARLCDSAERERMKGELGELDLPNGAAEAAAWLAAIGAERGGGSRGDGRAADAAPHAPSMSRVERGSFKAWRRRWGTFVASIPQTAYRLTKQELTKPKARTLVVALGIDDDRVGAAVESALADTDDPPEKVLVITDSFAAFWKLRELGVGFEHVPRAGERQAELPGGSYEEFLRERVRLILGERSKPRRVVVAPGSAPLP